MKRWLLLVPLAGLAALTSRLPAAPTAPASPGLAAPNADDLRLIQGMVDLAVECGLKGVSGVIGHDEDQGGRLRAIEFPRIRGGKTFDPSTPWFTALLDEIGQSHG